jgi:starch synthase (maltosyl-transferring)
MHRYPDRSLSVTSDRALRVSVDNPQAVFGTWYELFPRSFGRTGKHGTFGDCERLLPDIAKMGFDILYLPPIHPIGVTHRKGKNNATACHPSDPGCPWAIGSAQGGHKSVHPELGTLKSFRRFVQKARAHGLDVALDLAFQCSPDHPYVKAHPEWFRWRPDGSVQFAENPPKKYEDILPLNFECHQWKSLWRELKSVVLFWIEQGIHVFRVDNPHTKPFTFWEWLIAEVRRQHPEVIFLAEAFTRRKVMQRLAKVGFNQSYTYFTWRNTKWELEQYIQEFSQGKVGEYMRPNFWPNTPDILPPALQYGGRAAFIIRLILAATLSSSYGIYGPAYDLCVSDALPDKEEYLDSEKYELKSWPWQRRGTIRPVIERVNRIRHDHPALHRTRNIRIYPVDNEAMLCYGKAAPDGSETLITVISIDPHHKQAGWVTLPLEALGLDPSTSYAMIDLLSNDTYLWQGERNYIELDPSVMPAHILQVRGKLRRENDFDYFS